MKVVVSLDHHFVKYKDNYYTRIVFFRDFWERYLKSFDEVIVVARAKEVTLLEDGFKESSGKNIIFYPLPDFSGATSNNLLLLPIIFFKIGMLVSKLLSIDPPAFILRSPGIISSLLYLWLKFYNYPFGVEVIGEPLSSLSFYHWGKDPIVKLLTKTARRSLSNILKKQCKEAVAVAYVTKVLLPELYPPSKDTFSTVYSSLSLPQSLIKREQKKFSHPINQFTIINTATMNTLWKGQEVLIKAFSILITRNRSKNLKLVLIGDGKYKDYYKKLTKQLGIEDRVEFTGMLPGIEAIIPYLDRGDLFVLPSLGGEGLPRALIEAMARGLPCIATDVGGSTELLPESYIVPPGNPQLLAEKIESMMNSPEILEQLSLMNIKKAEEYAEPVLEKKRTEFYNYVRERTLNYIAKR